MRRFLTIAAISGALAVALGAFGAHALEGKIAAKYIANWQTAVHYQMFHTTAILAVGMLLKQKDSKLLTTAGWLFTIGILIFSGSLYTLSLTGISILGAITPIGGVAFIAGWIYFMRFAWKQ